MKKLLFALTLVAIASAGVGAQETTTTVKNETKVKKTSTVPQKVHNTFSRKKHYNGKKIKHTETEVKTTTQPAQ